MNQDVMLKQALFEAARHLSTPEQRRAYLDRACEDDPELRRQIEALLELEVSTDEFFREISFSGHGRRGANSSGRPDRDAGSAAVLRRTKP